MGERNLVLVAAQCPSMMDHGLVVYARFLRAHPDSWASARILAVWDALSETFHLDGSCLEHRSEVARVVARAVAARCGQLQPTEGIVDLTEDLLDMALDLRRIGFDRSMPGWVNQPPPPVAG